MVGFACSSRTTSICRSVSSFSEHFPEDKTSRFNRRAGQTADPLRKNIGQWTGRDQKSEKAAERGCHCSQWK